MATTRVPSVSAGISERRSARLGALLLLAGLLQGCSSLLFMPSRTEVRTPADIGLAYEDVTLTTKDGVDLHAWWLPASGSPRGTVLFLHGNAENISTHIASVWWLPAAGYQVLLLDYRGYGASGGSPSIPAVFGDIEAAFAWLRSAPEARGPPLFLLGQSLGASLGGYVVGSDPEVRAGLTGVVLDSAFARYRWVAREVAARSWLLWPVQWPIAASMPDDYDLIDVVGSISPVPLLIIHGREDQVVSYHHAEDLFAASRDPKSFLSYDGPHIGTFRDPENRRIVLDFMTKAAADAASGREPARP